MASSTSSSDEAKLPQQAATLKASEQSASDDATRQQKSQQPLDDAALPQVPKKPIACIVVGMAGSGKTTFMQRLAAHVHEAKIPSYIVNLDPAVADVPYPASIDIRDTVNYKEVMKQYNLGPNGAIMTSLNLFSTRFDQVVGLIEKRAKSLDYIFIDTPGQIEIFTWSASGTIVTESIASGFTTVLCYVVDTPRSANPTTFMSNMLYACSILYKSKLPLVIVFNKTDVVKHDFAVEWMTDYEAFEAALFPESNYMATLTRSMSLVLDEFYKNLKTVGVSAVTGEGIDDFFKVIEEAGGEYHEYYRKALEKQILEKKQREEKLKEEQIARLKKDMESSRGSTVVLSSRPKAKAAGDDDDDFDAQSDDEEGDDEDEEPTEEELRELEAFKKLCAEDRRK